MNNDMTPPEPLCQWEFWLADENPGPSLGDAAELIEWLGFNPWAFSKLELLSESNEGKMVTSKFAVVGSRVLVEGLRAAHSRATGSSTAPIQLPPGFPNAEVHS